MQKYVSLPKVPQEKHSKLFIISFSDTQPYLKNDWEQKLLFYIQMTVFDHFFTICMFIFHKPEVQTDILICSKDFNFN